MYRTCRAGSALRRIPGQVGMLPLVSNDFLGDELRLPGGSGLCVIIRDILV